MKRIHFIDVGQRFHRLTVLSEAPAVKGRRAHRCCCDCGTERVVLAQHLVSGNTVSCGCYSRERSITHGMRNSPEYSCWRAMLKRCENPEHHAYGRYGGAGISVCDEWHSFEVFFADMGLRPSLRHTIERRQNDKGYEPGNCYWADWTTQERNRRNTRMLEYSGVSRPVADWAEIVGIPRPTILRRLDAGWSAEDALFRQVRRTSDNASPDSKLTAKAYEVSQ